MFMWFKIILLGSQRKCKSDHIFRAVLPLLLLCNARICAGKRLLQVSFIYKKQKFGRTER